MGYLRAQVHSGRLILDVPSTLPEGTIVELDVVAVGSSAAPAINEHGAFDEAEADTAVGPLLAEETSWTSLAKPSS